MGRTGEHPPLGGSAALSVEVGGAERSELALHPVNEPTTDNDEIPTSIEGLIGLVGELREKLGALEAMLAERDARIKQLEASLEESRRSGKRQAAPFSKSAPSERPAKPGRKPGDAHGRHGHRMVPAPLIVSWTPPCPMPVLNVVVA
ncbi:MAG: hypothetical protein ACRD0E_00165 [Acidimicrobiales bacterium]